jgi:hypothetical protein
MRLLLPTLLLVSISSLVGAPQDAAAKDAACAAILRDLATCAANTDKVKRLDEYDALAKRLGVAPKVPGNWTVSTSVSPIDDSKTVTLGLGAEQDISTGGGKTFQPQLVLRCKAGKIELYTITGVPMSEEKSDHRSITTVRFGTEKAVTMRMDRSSDGESIFWPDADANAEKLLHAERLAVLISPKEFEPVALEFDLRGLSDVYPQLAAACAKAK